MGIDSSGIQFVCMAKNYGVDFRQMLTIGRQNLFTDVKVMERAKRALGVDSDFTGVGHEYADEFFAKVLGVEDLQSLDATPYEDATLIHDLNRPLPPELRNRFNVVFDGGSVEHVFNCVQAYKNMMQMVRVGGWFLQLTSGNNLLGHGFWQISPEFLYRCFCPENGFERPLVLLKELQLDDSWWRPADPAEVQHRVELANRLQTNIFTIARKTADVEPFATPPQQSDYSAMWSGERKASNRIDAAHRSILDPGAWRRRLSFLPKSARVAVNNTAKALGLRPEFDPRHYRRIREADLLRGRVDA